MFRFIKIGITLILVTIFINLKAQQSECIKGKGLEKLDKEIVLKLTLAYFEDYGVDKGLNEIEKQGVNNFKKLINNKNLENYPGSVITFLKDKKNGWSSSGLKVFNEYYNSMQKAKKEDSVFCKESIFKPKNIKSTKHLDSTFSALSKQALAIAETKNEPVVSKEPEVKKNNNSEVKPEQQTNTESIVESKDSNYLKEWIYWIIIGILFVIIFAFYRFSKKTDNELYNFNKKYKKLKEGNNYQIENLKQNLSRAKSEINNLETKIENLKQQLTSNQNSSDTQKNQTEIKKSELKPKLINEEKKELYFPSPNDDGKFKLIKAKDEITRFSLYKIEFNKDEKSGSLWIVENEEMFELALNSPDKYLETACKYSNAREDHHKYIETITPGKVILDENDWTIKEKVIIKFV